MGPARPRFAVQAPALCRRTYRTRVNTWVYRTGFRKPESGYFLSVLIPAARGALSAALFDAMRTTSADADPVLGIEPESRDDAHIALWALYELHYRGFEDAEDDLEWNPAILGVRRRLEECFEDLLRSRFKPPERSEPFAESLEAYIEAHDGPSLATFVQRQADKSQVLDLLKIRTIYHLKESDPTAWVVPRLEFQTQAALMELQFDEYGAGDPNRLHSHLYAKGIEASGLRTDYGAYIDEAPVEILEQNNAMSMFGLHRRLRGASLGHLAAFEATSSLPCRRMAQGLARLEFPREMIDYYDEHVEADAVHEQLAVRTICAPLVQSEPDLTEDVFFGAYSCLDLESRFADAFLGEGAAA